MVATDYAGRSVEEVVVTDDALTVNRPSMDWGAIFGGAVIGAAVSMILLTFGTAIGLSTTSPFRGEAGLGLTGLAIATAIWVVISQVVSFGIGGYFAGRMRRRGSISAREAEIRDSAHGLVAWGVAAIATVLIGGFLAAGAVSKTADVASTAAAGAGAAGAAAAASQGDRQGTMLTDYYADQLFRAEGEGSATADVQPAREEASRILTRGAMQGGVPAEDKDYLARLVAAQTGIPEADARTRVDQVLQRATDARNQAEETARAAADAARRGTIVLGFLSAASLLAGAAAAAFGARRGGHDRDEGTAYRYFS
jgi:hypothetical protein